ncbi:MAG TPA: hypothetical protein VEL28_07840 [Candidatus Binatia bacterium]|nr:hypothetical protein [Candidatus Binatia bacterium]
MQTAFLSDRTFTQDQFARWLDDLSASDINHYELLGGRIVMTPPAGYPHSPVALRLAAPPCSATRRWSS